MCRGPGQWQERFLDFLFDLIESISSEVVRGFDEVCPISYNFQTSSRNSSSRTPASSPAFVQRAMANGLNLFLLIISILEILLLQIGYVRCPRIHKKLATKSHGRSLTQAHAPNSHAARPHARP